VTDELQTEKLFPCFWGSPGAWVTARDFKVRRIDTKGCSYMFQGSPGM
jgi:hypothetical protein